MDCGNRDMDNIEREILKRQIEQECLDRCLSMERTIREQDNEIFDLQSTILRLEGELQKMRSKVSVDAKCQLPDGAIIKPDGKHELDPCVYREIEAYKNVTVHVLRCKNCGHTEVEWERQENTELIEVE